MTHSTVLAQTNKARQALLNYWQGIDWDAFTTVLISKIIAIVVMTAFILIIKKIGEKLIRQSFHSKRMIDTQGKSRIETLYALTRNVFKYVLFFIYIYSLLTLIGIPVGSLLAGAGIAGVAIGLGAQGFINDFITGFFIIFEKQIEVGDYVIINQSEGVVQTVGLRTTQIRSLDGIVHFIPNRTILVVSNLSKENRLAVIQLRVLPTSDIERIKNVITQVNQRLTPSFPEITQDPEIVGLVDSGNGNLNLKIIIHTLNGAQTKIQASFLEHYLQALKEAGIELPLSPLNLSTIK